MVDVNREALEYLVELGKKTNPVETLDFGGRKYTRQDIKPVIEPLVTAIQISTLSSLSDLCGTAVNPAGGDHGFEGFDINAHVVHVVNEKHVQVVASKSNEWKAREVLINCQLTETLPFAFGQFMNQDKFIIAMLSCFVKSDERAGLAKLAGNATAEKVTTAQDDGVSQLLGTRAGAHLQDQVAAKNIVSLAPYRTFREVEQPSSDFLFRVEQSGDNVPKFALFEADGGAWKLEALENIARKLRTLLPTGATVVS